MNKLKWLTILTGIITLALVLAGYGLWRAWGDMGVGVMVGVIFSLAVIVTTLFLAAWMQRNSLDAAVEMHRATKQAETAQHVSYGRVEAARQQSQGRQFVAPYEIAAETLRLARSEHNGGIDGSYIDLDALPLYEQSPALADGIDADLELWG